MNRRSILAAYKKKSSHLQTGVTGFKSGNLFKVVRKHYSTPSPCTAPVTARNASVWVRLQRIGTVPVQPNIAPNSPFSGDFLFYSKGIYLNGISLYR